MNILFLLLFWSLWFLNFSTRTVLSPLLPIFEKELHISHALAGSIFLFMAVGYTSSLLVSNWITPRIGFKKSIAVGFVVLIGALISLVFTRTYWGLGAVAFVLGFGGGLYLPCALPLLTSTIHPDKWGKAIAFHETAATFSILVIPLLAAAALRFLDWTVLVVVLSGLCLAVTVVFLVRSPDLRPKAEEKSPFSRVLRRKDFWIMATLWSFASASGLGLYNLIPLFLVNEKGLSIDVANSIFGLSRIGGLVVTLLAGLLIDRFGVKSVLLLSLLASGLSITGIALADSFPLLVTMLVFQATFMPVFFPAGLVTISKLTNLGDRSAFAGATVAIGVVFGTGIAPTLLGTVADVWSFQVGMLVQGLLTIGVCLLLKSLRGL
ncbi:MAG: transporter [Deltaproteobacteria bacterium]|nr:transporter [Deltaproteobacteria bacterium]